MNKKRRCIISDNLSILIKVKENFENVLYDEQDSYDNMPENLQYSMRGMESEDAIDCLDEGISLIKQAIENLSDAIDVIEEI